MVINLAKINLAKIGESGQVPSANLQDRTVDVLLTDASTVITPDAGYDALSRVRATHGPVQQEVIEEVSVNGSHIITPSEGYDAFIYCRLFIPEPNMGAYSADLESSNTTWTYHAEQYGYPGFGQFIANIKVPIYTETYFLTSPAQWDGTPDTELVSSLGWSQTSYDSYPVNWMSYENEDHKVSEYDKTYEATGSHQGDKQITYAKMQVLDGDCSNLFNRCAYLKAIPDFDFTNVTNAKYMFNGDIALEFLPALDLKNITSARNMFCGCTRLTILPKLNLSGVQDMQNMFSNCTNLKYVPDFDFSSATNLSGFYENTAIEEIGDVIAPNCTRANYLFAECPVLHRIGRINMADNVNNNKMFNNSTHIQSIAGFSYRGTYKNAVLTTTSLNKLTHFIFEDYLNCTWDTGLFNLLPNLDYESIKSILTACSKTTLPETAKSITFADITIQDQNGELQTLINTCVNEKGWTINNITITE